MLLGARLPILVSQPPARKLSVVCHMPSDKQTDFLFCFICLSLLIGASFDSTELLLSICAAVVVVLILTTCVTLIVMLVMRRKSRVCQDTMPPDK